MTDEERAEAMRRVGARIAELRKLHDLSQATFAEQCYVTQPAVSQWERGVTMPRKAIQYRVADVLRFDRSKLFAEVLEIAA